MFNDLDPILHSQLRLAVMSLLMGVKEAEFTFVKEKTGATAGNRSGEGVAGANLPNQLGAFLSQSGGGASSSALYTVFIGGNDVRNAALHTTTADAANAAIAAGVSAGRWVS